MLRTKLIAACAGCIGLILVMAGLLFWGPVAIERQIERSLWAHQQTEAYLRLSSEAYAHFWQLADQLVVAAGTGTPSGQAPASPARIRAELQRLEQLTLAEVAFVGQGEPDEQAELVRLQQLADAIAAGIVAFNRVADQSGSAPERAQSLALLRRKVDQDFARLIDVAIADEQSETQAADQQMRTLIDWLRGAAGGFAALAILLVCGIGLWLLRSVTRPVALLLEGTRQIAGGHLGHRIPLAGHDELARLAASFNDMAGDLEQRRAELLRAQSELEHKVGERTAELAKANLTLQRLDEVRRRMFADISHELRTPLTIISGEAEVTLRSQSGLVEDYRRTLARIVDLSGQLARLIEDLMLLARSDSADLRIRPRRVLIEAVLREAAEDLRALASGREVSFACRLPADPAQQVEADPGRLAQLLLILVDNASRYTPPGGRIELACELRGNQAVIQVRDTGIGIAAHELPAVFDRYFRGEQARRLASKGSGLGLHVAQTIALAHGGRLLIDSTPGQGTTVTLLLPLPQPDREDHADPAD